jgi:hypothetical protein
LWALDNRFIEMDFHCHPDKPWPWKITRAGKNALKEQNGP